MQCDAAAAIYHSLLAQLVFCAVLTPRVSPILPSRSLATANVRAQADETQRRLLASEAAVAALQHRLQQSEAQLQLVAAESDRRAAQRHALSEEGAAARRAQGTRAGAAQQGARLLHDPVRHDRRPLLDHDVPLVRRPDQDQDP